MTKITGKESIGELIQKYPQIVPIIESFGLHCTSCSSSNWETLEQGAKGHGLENNVVEKLITSCNDYIENRTDKITLTQNAINKLKQLMQNESKNNHGLRIEVITGGCSGFKYDLSVEEKPKENDFVYDQENVKIFVAKDSYDVLKGSLIDYIDALQGAGFKVINPNSSKECGCGKSFA
ncbi:iron-sulfur cluster assembly accessory protein [Candidatus Woesearchaeota archaeon]|jgi:iron-sulfur cluster assembly accessory protein|nr:iron-sulfur cluster assembly accessory protein [Candidatus Woesearchaeota archaeon]MBT4595842.1 iron-sulfur cluster assembly accessory protein [Candidatus Woesearchaeota archaeon]MBT5741309.1 iron-sulfur cluster assembly accessory protein [Candidatus Woesearchaeota archaeon]MBT6505991.1 iron-sulfur cluster assembly accessory protein [Candidatus Woesearchaeota archaeon]MBT7297115.1 iron-sulfur cluster assembly accessory protein [Candidatus Woesearchaeota archaeon]